MEGILVGMYAWCVGIAEPVYKGGWLAADCWGANWECASAQARSSLLILADWEFDLAARTVWSFPRTESSFAENAEGSNGWFVLTGGLEYGFPYAPFVGDVMFKAPNRASKGDPRALKLLLCLIVLRTYLKRSGRTMSRTIPHATLMPIMLSLLSPFL